MLYCKLYAHLGLFCPPDLFVTVKCSLSDNISHSEKFFEINAVTLAYL